MNNTEKGKSSSNSTVKLMLILFVLMVALAGMFVFISSQNTKLKTRVRELEAELYEAEKSPPEDITVIDGDTVDTNGTNTETGEAVTDDTDSQAVTEAPVLPQFEAFTDDYGNIVPAAVIYDNGTERWDFPFIEGKGSAPVDFSEVRVEDDDRYRRAIYDKDGNKLTRFGIDVSKHQGSVNWQAAADDGVEFAFIRAGARGYETGKLTEDDRFADNYRGAKDAGLAVGVYYFSQATNAEEGREEALYVVNILRDHGCLLELPVVFDWEKIGGGEIARTDDTPMEDITDACAAFCETIEENGYKAMFYSNIRSAFFHYDIERLPYDMWLADYGDTTAYIYDYRFWQYSQSGRVEGVDGFVDYDLWFTDEE